MDVVPLGGEVLRKVMTLSADPGLRPVLFEMVALSWSQVIPETSLSFEDRALRACMMMDDSRLSSADWIPKSPRKWNTAKMVLTGSWNAIFTYFLITESTFAAHILLSREELR